MPSTRPEFWSRKIESTVRRDALVRQELRADGWRFATVWECALKGRDRLGIEEVASRIASWLEGTAAILEVAGE